jgi:hypothetical protein
MAKRSGITLFQLFFLSFSYVFSGLFLIRETAFLSLLVPLAFALPYCVAGYFFLRLASGAPYEKERWLAFLSGGRAHTVGRLFAAFLLLIASVELIFTWLSYTVSVSAFSEFLSFSFVAVLILLLALFVGGHGLAVIGRFAELFTFLIVPPVLWLIFWDFAPLDFGAFSENLYAFLIVSPAPILYLFSETVLQSTAVPNGSNNPIKIPAVCFSGAIAAVLCAFLFLLYGADKNNIFLLLFGWMAALVRLSLLICVCTAGRSGRTEYVCTAKKKKASKEEQ